MGDRVRRAMILKLDPHQWLSSDFGPPEVRHTSALLGIAAGDKLATHVVDAWSRSVSDRIRVSLWPLGLWLANNWWRLRWEPAPITRSPSPNWRMAHEMPAAGHGFVWPHLRFASDGESVEVRCDAAPASDAEPIEYLSSFSVPVPAQQFESAIDECIETTIARLTAVGCSEGELQALWAEVREERTDPELSEYRRLEAELGFDPDEAPAATVEKLLKLRAMIGVNGVREIAPACSGPDLEARLGAILALDGSASVKGRFDLPRVSAPDRAAQPWERGRQLAKDVRAKLGLGISPLADLKLSEFLGVEPSKLSEQAVPSHPVGAAIRRADEQMSYAFRKKPRSGRRFEAARWIAEALVAPSSERWLISADTATARQKFQRAFAAELLAPIDGVKDLLEADYSDAAIDDAGEHFGVSPLAIKSHLANHGELPHDAVGVRDPSAAG